MVRNYDFNNAKTQCLKILSSIIYSSNNDSTLNENSECDIISEKCVCKSGFKYNYVWISYHSNIGNDKSFIYFYFIFIGFSVSFIFIILNSVIL